VQQSDEVAQHLSEIRSSELFLGTAGSLVAGILKIFCLGGLICRIVWPSSSGGAADVFACKNDAVKSDSCFGSSGLYGDRSPSMVDPPDFQFIDKERTRSNPKASRVYTFHSVLDR
jgi:hypothetical protein